MKSKLITTFLNCFLAFVLGGLALAESASAQGLPGVTPTRGAPRQNPGLYYRAGGGDPAPLSANPNSINLRFGLQGYSLMSYSCGRFDIGQAFEYYMAEFSRLGQTIQGAIGAAVMALPMYIFQRAQPGLYELFQNYWVKAQLAIQIALRSCEEMEAQVKAGGDPYQDYINLAKGEGWKFEAAAGSNPIQAKENVQQRGGVRGLEPIPGLRRGGRGQPPLRVVHDLTSVGYNVTMNQLPESSKDTASGGNTRLGRLWATPREASDWAVSVLGDQEVATCDDADCGRGDGGTGKSVITGLGLQPKFEAAISEVEAQLVQTVSQGDPSLDALERVSAPGVSIGRDVIESLRRLPDGTRAVMTSRLAREVALSRTVERALTVRNLLQTGMTTANYEKPVEDARKRVDQLNRHIEDLMFEVRVRKEIVSNTANMLLENDRNSAVNKSSSVPGGREASPQMLEGGRVLP